MICKKCGAQFEGNFCPKCGTKAEQPITSNGESEQKLCPKCGTSYNGNFCPKGCNSPALQQQVAPKKKMKFWQILLIVLGVFFAIGIIGAALGGPSDNEDDISDKKEQSTHVASDEKTDVLTEAPSPEASFEEELATYQEIEFEILARNPDKYKGEKFKFTGQVIQVQEPLIGSTVTLRINVTRKTYEYIDSETWTDTVYATVKIPDGEDRILEGDIITFYGECQGMYTYTSVLGASVSLPKIDIKYWSLAE